jgi:hypothetical protein
MIKELDIALKAGRLPVNTTSRRIIDTGLARIKYTQRGSVGVKPQTVKAFKLLADAADVFGRVAFQSDAGRQAVSIIEEEALWHAPIEVTKYRETINLISETATFYNQLYSRNASCNRRRKDRENCMLYDIYSLYSGIKIAAGERPGIAGPLYRFTKECMRLLGKHLRISEPAFRMRIQRVKNKRLQGIDSLASAL